MSRGPHDDRGGEAVVETVDGHAYITVRVPVGAIHLIAPVALDHEMVVTDEVTFAVDLVREINAEDEHGNNSFQRWFDNEIRNAVDQGADGVEEVS